MAPDSSIAIRGVAESQTLSGQGAHDMLHVDSEERATLREATQAHNTSSSLDFDLESPTIEDESSTPRDLEVNSHHLRDQSHDVLATGSQAGFGVTSTGHDKTRYVGGEINSNHELDRAAPFSASIIQSSPLLHDDTTPPVTPPFPNINDTALKTSAPTIPSQTESETALSNTVSLQHTSKIGEAGSANKPHEGNMLFSYRATGPASAAHRRRQYATTSALTNYEADLTGKDRAKQKEAVRKLLMEKIRDDWKWVWPQPQPDLEAQSQTQSDGGIKSEIVPEVKPENDALSSPIQAVETRESRQESAGEEYGKLWKRRDEWLSNASDSEAEITLDGPKRAEKANSVTKDHPFQFETPDGIGEKLNKTISDRKRRRKKRLAEEMAWNDGLQCFMQRRDAWTGARPVTHSYPVKQFRKSMSHSSQDGGSSTAMDPETDADEDEDGDDTFQVPVAPPLIPPENAMRASITPTAYNTIYDKIILQNLNPSCPINLKDITRSCVQGWKRDGEWPPKSSVPDTLGTQRRRRSLASLFGLEKTRSKEDRERLEKEKAENEAHRELGDHKPGAFKKFTRKLLLLGKDKDHEHDLDHVHNGSIGKAKESAATGTPVS